MPPQQSWRAEQAAKHAANRPRLLWGAGALLLCILFVKLVAGAGSSGHQEQVLPPPPRPVAYKIVEQWSIPNGGYGKAVVVPNSAANESSLRALGEELKYDTRGDRNAFIFVFSDERAAAIRLSVLEDKAPKQDVRFYDNHFVATYTRNINTGFHQLSITPKGLNGPQIDVNY